MLVQLQKGDHQVVLVVQVQASRGLPQSLQHSTAELGAHQTGQTRTAYSHITVLRADQGKELDGSMGTIPKIIQIAYGGYEAAKL